MPRSGAWDTQATRPGEPPSCRVSCLLPAGPYPNQTEQAKSQDGERGRLGRRYDDCPTSAGIGDLTQREFEMLNLVEPAERLDVDVVEPAAERGDRVFRVLVGLVGQRADAV